MKKDMEFHGAVEYLSSSENTNMLEYFEVYEWVLQTAQPFVRDWIIRTTGMDEAEVARCLQMLRTVENLKNLASRYSGTEPEEE